MPFRTESSNETRLAVSRRRIWSIWPQIGLCSHWSQETSSVFTFAPNLVLMLCVAGRAETGARRARPLYRRLFALISRAFDAHAPPVWCPWCLLSPFGRLVVIFPCRFFWSDCDVRGAQTSGAASHRSAAVGRKFSFGPAELRGLPAE